MKRILDAFIYCFALIIRKNERYTVHRIAACERINAVAW